MRMLNYCRLAGTSSNVVRRVADNPGAGGGPGTLARGYCPVPVPSDCVPHMRRACFDLLAAQ
jgi:hypothetical protein